MNSEHALIQLLLRNPHKTVDLVRKGVKAKYFKQKEIGKAFKLIHDRHTQLNSVPTDEELGRLGITVETEEIPYTVEHLVENILEEYNKQFTKDAIRAASELLTEKGPQAARELLLEATNHYVGLGQNQRSKDITEVADEVFENYLQRAKHKGQIIGVPTGFHIFDNHTMGLQPQWLITIAGRNASFKTWVLTSWVQYAWQRGNNIAVFSCEMSINQLAERIYALNAKVAPTKVRHGQLEQDEIDRFQQTIQASREAPYGKLIIDDNPTSIEEVDARIDQLNKQCPLDIVFIDSAYRMQSSGDSDVAKQRNIAQQAKNLATKYNIPVVCTVQLNRDFAKENATDKNKDKTKGGGYFIYGTDGWNQDSDIVLMLNRPEAYVPFNYSDFILDKFRHGPQGENFILEINLAIPKIEQVEFDFAKSRIGGAPPPQTQKAQSLFNLADNLVDLEILENFKKQGQQNQDGDNPPPQLAD